MAPVQEWLREKVAGSRRSPLVHAGIGSKGQGWGAAAEVKDVQRGEGSNAGRGVSAEVGAVGGGVVAGLPAEV